MDAPSPPEYVMDPDGRRLWKVPAHVVQFDPTTYSSESRIDIPSREFSELFRRGITKNFNTRALVRMTQETETAFNEPLPADRPDVACLMQYACAGEYYAQHWDLVEGMHVIVLSNSEDPNGQEPDRLVNGFVRLSAYMDVKPGESYFLNDIAKNFLFPLPPEVEAAIHEVDTDDPDDADVWTMTGSFDPVALGFEEVTTLNDYFDFLMFMSFKTVPFHMEEQPSREDEPHGDRGGEGFDFSLLPPDVQQKMVMDLVISECKTSTATMQTILSLRLVSRDVKAVVDQKLGSVVREAVQDLKEAWTAAQEGDMATAVDRRDKILEVGLFPWCVHQEESHTVDKGGECTWQHFARVRNHKELDDYFE